MADRSTQILGLGNVRQINADPGQSAEARRYTIANNAGKAKVTNRSATLGLAYKAGNASVDCASEGAADAVIEPGATYLIEAPDGFVSFLEVTLSETCIVCTVR